MTKIDFLYFIFTAQLSRNGNIYSVARADQLLVAIFGLFKYPGCVRDMVCLPHAMFFKWVLLRLMPMIGTVVLFLWNMDVCITCSCFICEIPCMYPLSLLVFCKAEREDEQESVVVSIAKNTKYLEPRLGKTLVAAPPQLCFLEVFTREATSLNKSLDVTNVAFNELLF